MTSEGSIELFGTDEQINRERLKGRIESFLLVSGEPLGVDLMTEALDGWSRSEVSEALEALREEYNCENRGIFIKRVAGGYQLRTNPEYKDDISALYEKSPVKLSSAAKETLAIVAYQQPITRAEVDEIRGVDSSAMVRKLKDFDLVERAGRLEDLGRPYLYRTTEYFLEVFGLDSLEDLPALDPEEVQKLDEMYCQRVES